MSEERASSEAGDDTDLDTLDDLLGLEPEEDAPAEEGEREQPVEEEQQPARRPPQSRGEHRVMQLRNKLREQEEENRRLRDAVLNQTRQPAYIPQPDPYRQAELDRQEAERVAQMMPHEAAAYYSSKAEQRMGQQLLQGRLEVADILDRQSFQQICRDEPMAGKLRDQVETLLSQARRNGSNPTREAIYNQLLAAQVRPRMNNAELTRARRQGRAAIARQTTQPGGGRSSVTQQRNGRAEESDAEFEARLRRVRIGDL